MSSSRGARDERWMIRIDVCRLNVNQALRVSRRRTQTFAKKFRDDLNELSMQSRETLKLL